MSDYLNNLLFIVFYYLNIHNYKKKTYFVFIILLKKHDLILKKS